MYARVVKPSKHQTSTNEQRMWQDPREFTSVPPTYTMSRIESYNKKHQSTTRKKVNLSEITFTELENEIKYNIESLIMKSRCSEWRNVLLHFMQFSLSDKLADTLHYFQHLIETVIHVHNIEPERTHVIPVTSLDVSKPSTVSIQQWHHLIASLNLKIEEPDTSFMLTYTSVLVPKHLNICVLEGFLSVLEALLYLGSDIIQLFCRFSPDEGANVLALLQEVLHSPTTDLPVSHSLVVPVWGKYSRTREFLQLIGLTQIKTEQRKRVLRLKCSSRTVMQVACIILTAFHKQSFKTLLVSDL
ncbi:uncharacterized protein LOC100370076 [Saccoglossus kowalevskii]